MKKDDFFLKQEVKDIVGSKIANYYRVIPFEVNNNVVTLLSSNSKIELYKGELELLLDKTIKIKKVTNDVIERYLAKYYRTSKTNKKITLSKNKDFLKEIITEAESIDSSDIHIEIYEKIARIRFRIDGKLIERFTIEKSNYQELVNKIKIRANLDITEKRLPQDGRIRFNDFDIRISVIPTLYGEKIVLRILGKNKIKIDINNLGFDKNDKEAYLTAIKKTNGIILISGPTGSGKTTTLYATLKVLNDVKRNILTIEDPIEYTLPGINQVQLKEDIGLTFQAALRSFLRQDPDIIMIGEIRDTETANMAIRAALTGHLVLSTIHTNSAKGTISRLVDMGIPPFLISETLNLSVAQRLVRKLCNNCKKKVKFTKEELPKNFIPSYKISEHSIAVGCEQCYYTGYKGRTAIYELIPINNDIKKLIKQNDDMEKVNEMINYKNLKEKAYDLLSQQETSLEEIYEILITN